MALTLQPLDQDDEALHPVNPRSDLSQVAPEILQQIGDSPINAMGIVEARPDLYNGVDPTLGDGGVIKSMTVKPAEMHTIDLEAQISHAIDLNKPDTAPNVLIADMQKNNPIGGAEFASGQQVMGSTGFVSPDADHKTSSLAQPAPKNPEPQQPNIIMGQM